jgi:hypothetical protein
MGDRDLKDDSDLRRLHAGEREAQLIDAAFPLEPP